MSELYHNRILELAAGIPHVGRLSDAEGSVTKVSRVCGSIVHVDLTLDEAGERVASIAVDPQACALGQAATAILAEHGLYLCQQAFQRVCRHLIPLAPCDCGCAVPRGQLIERRLDHAAQ